MSAAPIRVGDFARDTSTGEIGRVMEIEGLTVILRTVTGTVLWQAERKRIAPATVAEALRGAVREHNNAARDMRGVGL